MRPIPGPTPLGEVSISDHNGVRIVSLYGEHDLATADAVSAQLDKLLSTGSSVAVDLSQAGFIDSSIVASLARASNAAREMSRELVVCAPNGSFARRLLDLVGADGWLTVVESREAAVRLLGPASP